MPEYTPSIDAQISESLRFHGRVLPSDLAGIDDAEAVLHLQRYLEIHGGETPLEIRDGVLTWAQRREAAPKPSPVDQVLAAPQGKALLDTPPSGSPVSPGYWALPALMGLIGGIIAWLLVKDENPRVARSMLVLGVLLQLSTACIGFALALGPLSSLDSVSRSDADAASWPASASGKPTLYYFGTST